MTLNNPNLKLLLITCICLLIPRYVYAAAPSSSQLPDLLQQAKIATVKGDFKFIVELLNKYEVNFGGDANFDYYLGTALLETGRFSEAIFVLDRAAADPKFAGAKFELARAYFQNREYPEAQKLFERLLTKSTPKKLVDTINTYLRAISSRENEYKTIHRPAVSFNIGYDSNANNAPDVEKIGAIFLSDKNREQASSFYTLHLSDLYSKPLAPDWRWRSRGSIYLRNNPNADFVDMQMAVLETGFNWSNETDNLSIDIGGLHSNVNGEPLPDEQLDLGYQTENISRNGNFFNISLSRKTATNSIFSFSTKITTYRHEPILRIRDMTQTSFDIGYQTNLSRTWQLSSNVVIAKDNVESESSPYGNSRFGINLSLAHPFSPNLLSRMSLRFSDINYDGKFLGQHRDDTQVSIDYSLNWMVSQKMSYSSKISWLDYDSNNITGLYSYQKSTIEFAVNYQF